MPHTHPFAPSKTRSVLYRGAVFLLSHSHSLHHACNKPANNSNTTNLQAPSQLPPSFIREPQYPIHLIFLERWSPRAMAQDLVSEQELMSLFEAVRWAPSAFKRSSHGTSFMHLTK